MMVPRILTRRIEVEWLDSLVLDHGEWMDVDDAKEALTNDAMRQSSCGYLVHEDDVGLVLAVSRNGDHDRFQGVVVIPAGAVTMRRELEV